MSAGSQIRSNIAVALGIGTRQSGANTNLASNTTQKPPKFNTSGATSSLNPNQSYGFEGKSFDHLT